MQEIGTLYICATPIGNLQDITLRVLDVLRNVDFIACEDTRKTLHLLTHFDIKKPLTSYYEHNKFAKGDYIISRLLAGESAALVSDAGMPGISDPGYELIVQCKQANIPYTVLPGASAALTALVLSGLPSDRFCFEGFLPRDKKQRRNTLNQLADEERTMIFYEAPHRIAETLQAFSETFGDRPMAACRELTKKFEEVLHGSAQDILTQLQAQSIKGEFVLIVSGHPPAEDTPKDLSWAIERCRQLQASGISEKEAIKQAAKEAGLPKRDLYNAFVSLKNRSYEFTSSEE